MPIQAALILLLSCSFNRTFPYGDCRSLLIARIGFFIAQGVLDADKRRKPLVAVLKSSMRVTSRNCVSHAAKGSFQNLRGVLLYGGP